MRWQDRVRQLVRDLGLSITSGYRTPEHNAEIGGARGSYHTKGTKGYPGAFDVSGDREKLIDLCHRIEGEFAGRINELFLNLHNPDKWYAVKANKHMDHNPEEGHAQHLHIALQPKKGT